MSTFLHKHLLAIDDVETLLGGGHALSVYAVDLALVLSVEGHAADTHGLGFGEDGLALSINLVEYAVDIGFGLSSRIHCQHIVASLYGGSNGGLILLELGLSLCLLGYQGVHAVGIFLGLACFVELALHVADVAAHGRADGTGQVRQYGINNVAVDGLLHRGLQRGELALVCLVVIQLALVVELNVGIHGLQCAPHVVEGTLNAGELIAVSAGPVASH